VVRSLIQRPSGATTWNAEPVDPQRPPSDLLYPEPIGSLLPFARSATTMAEWSRCPAAGFRWYSVLRGGKRSGYFCLTLTPGQARVADAWTPSENAQDWAHLYRLAIHAARQEKGIHEIRADAVPECCRQGLEMAGFRLRHREPLMIRDRRQRLPAGKVLHFQLMDGDGAFWHAGRPDYRL
jgi:hypothetical protein